MSNATALIPLRPDQFTSTKEKIMKRYRIAMCAALLLAVSAAMAQSKNGDVVADVPFPFVVAGHTLPAGHYVVSPISNSTLRIQGATNQGMFVPTNITQRSASDNSCKLVFHHYADSYFLSEIWATGNDQGRQLFRSRAEKELAAKVAAGENTVVAAR
jgi:hypothetical protein